MALFPFRLGIRDFLRSSLSVFKPKIKSEDAILTKLWSLPFLERRTKKFGTNGCLNSVAQRQGVSPLSTHTQNYFFPRFPLHTLPTRQLSPRKIRGKMDTCLQNPTAHSTSIYNLTSNLTYTTIITSLECPTNPPVNSIGDLIFINLIHPFLEGGVTKFKYY